MSEHLAASSVSSASSPTSAATRYTRTAVVLHWVLALGLIGLIGFGVYMTSLPFSPARLKLYNWHKWAGMTILALSVLRLIWRLTHRPPALPTAIAQQMPAWQHWAHHGTHHLLYVLFFAVPLLGWAYSSAAGFPVVWFGVWPLPDWVSPSPELAEVLKPLHRLSAFALAGLIVLHVGAALKHQWLDRDGLLSRMRLR
jgi:cytochrome b561